MWMSTKLRELFEGWDPSKEVTLQDVVASKVTERTVEEDPHEKVWARMPGDGDEDHPLYRKTVNPMPELGGPLALFRALQAGQIPPSKIRAVRAYLNAC
jgi:hypothetical protein